MPVPDQVRDDVSGIPAKLPAGRQKQLNLLDSGSRTDSKASATGMTFSKLSKPANIAHVMPQGISNSKRANRYEKINP